MSSAARVVLTRSAPVVRSAHNATARATAAKPNPLPFPSVFLESLGSPAPFKRAPVAKQQPGSATYSVYLDAHFQNCMRG